MILFYHAVKQSHGFMGTYLSNDTKGVLYNQLFCPCYMCQVCVGSICIYSILSAPVDPGAYAC